MLSHVKVGLHAAVALCCVMAACSVSQSESVVDAQAAVDTISIDEIAVFDFIVNDGEFLYATSSRTDTSLYVYNLADLKFIASGLPKGQGPNEIQYGPMAAYSNTAGVWLMGFGPGQFRRYKADGLQITALDTIKAGRSMAVNGLSIIDNKIVAYSDFPQSCRAVQFEAGKSSPRSTYQWSKTDNLTSLQNNEAVIFASNGKIAGIAYVYANKITLLNASKFTPIRKFEGDETAEGDDLPTYIGFEPSPNGLYALRLISREKMVFEFYDNDGNLKRRIHSDASPIVFTVDESRGRIIAYDTNHPDRFLVFTPDAL